MYRIKPIDFRQLPSRCNVLKLELDKELRALRGYFGTPMWPKN